MSIFVFDIETVPDVEGGRKIHQIDDLGDKDMAEVMMQQRRQQTGHDFLPLHLHKVVAISVLFSGHQQIKLWSLGDKDAGEKELIQRFFDGIEKYTPVLVTWNGAAFDLPVLHYRALVHGVASPTYWDVGGNDREFRWNNYLSRYHWRHIDVMDILSLYQMRAVASLDQVATLLGLPGKFGMDGSKVWDCYLEGGIEEIRDYCETDVLNTYLVYLRFELIRGTLSQEEYAAACRRVKDMLEQSTDKAHWQAFLSQWNKAQGGS